MGGNSIDVQI